MSRIKVYVYRWFNGEECNENEGVRVFATEAEREKAVREVQYGWLRGKVPGFVLESRSLDELDAMLDEYACSGAPETELSEPELEIPDTPLVEALQAISKAAPQSMPDLETLCLHRDGWSSFEECETMGERWGSYCQALEARKALQSVGITPEAGTIEEWNSDHPAED